MTDTNATTIRRNIVLSKTLDKKVNAKAKRAGLPYPEYIRHVLLKDADTPEPIVYDDWGPVPDEISDIWEIDTNEAIEQFRNGKIKSYNNAHDLMAALDNDE